MDAVACPDDDMTSFQHEGKFLKQKKFAPPSFPCENEKKRSEEKRRAAMFIREKKIKSIQIARQVYVRRLARIDSARRI
jgi:hypothetical protein